MDMRRLVFGVSILLLGCCCTVSGALITTGAAGNPITCDPATCKAPSCHCPANNPPGGLSPDQIPQFVLISHENALNGLSYDLLMDLIGNKTQSNGCNVPVTWFAMRYHSDCPQGQMAIARGDEVAMQANRFNPTDPFTATDPNPNYDSSDPVTGEPSVEREILMSREWWNRVCDLPLHNMVGYRSQRYINNPPVRQVLASKGYLYDATLVESWYPGSPTSPSLGQRLWPYTMDSGIPQDCAFFGPEVGKCAADEKHPGLWEVPLYQLQADASTLYGVSDYGNPELVGMPPIPDMEAMLTGQLDAHLANNRTPLIINVFYEWLGDKPENPPADDPRCIFCVRNPSANGLALADFVDYALTKPEVRFVTFSDLIRWMQDPVPLDQFDDWVQCSVPGVKADLSAVTLPEDAKAGAFYLTGPAQANTTAPTPQLNASEAAPAPALAQRRRHRFSLRRF